MGFEIKFVNAGTQTVAVTIIDNGVVENVKVFGATLSASDRAVIFDQPSAEVEITDADSESSHYILTLPSSSTLDHHHSLTL